MRKIAAFMLAIIIGVTGIGLAVTGRSEAIIQKKFNKLAASKEVRGLWIGFCDFGKLGLKNKSESEFRRNFASLLNKAKANGINTVYFHVRAFHDASYRSKYFKASAYLTSRRGLGKNVFKNYDPLSIVVKQCKQRNIECHAWMNPYRITYEKFLNPAKESSTADIKKAVSEVMKYGVDGIHFDDYFYHSKGNYVDVSTGETSSGKISSGQKRSNCNAMVKSIYKYVHKLDSDAKFGISPQGNYGNCMASGADVKKWLNKSGYIDYIVPQIYWTDNWSSSGNVRMYSIRLALWKAINKNKTDMMVGLALYRTGKNQSDDRGWGRKKTNLYEQVKKLRKAGMKGYVLFSAPNLSDSRCSAELANLREKGGIGVAGH